MQSKCNEGKYGCKYCGDLFDICPEYVNGSRNGEPIIIREEFPVRCKNCKERDLDFCKRFKDLICLNNQDPFNCKADLSKDKCYGEELIKKRIEALKQACLRRNLH